MSDRGTISDSTKAGPPLFLRPETMTSSAGQATGVFTRQLNLGVTRSTWSSRAFQNSTSVGGELENQRYAVIPLDLAESGKNSWVQERKVRVSINPSDVHAHTFSQLVQLTSEDGRYRLKHPVKVNVSDADQDGTFVVTDDFSTVYGAGSTPESAIRDYSMSLFDEFEDLTEEEELLGLGLQQELAALRLHIIRI